MACWANYFAEEPLDAHCWANFFAEEPLDARCWADVTSDRTENRLAGTTTSGWA